MDEIKSGNGLKSAAVNFSFRFPTKLDMVFHSMWCIVLLQPLWCRCVECVIYHERDVRKKQQYFYVAQTSNNKRDCDALSILLLAATVRSFAHFQLGLSNRNKIVLWPRCGSHAVWSLHKKNVRWVWFVVKKEGVVVATSPVALRWMCDSPWTGCVRRTTICIQGANKQC